MSSSVKTPPTAVRRAWAVVETNTGELCSVKFHKTTAQGVAETYTPGKVKLIKVMIVPMPRKWDKPLV